MTVTEKGLSMTSTPHRDLKPGEPVCCTGDPRGTIPVDGGIFGWLRRLRTRRHFLQLLAAGSTLMLPRWLRAGVPDSGPCGKPPPPKPAHAAGAEGIPPLPLPAQPLRRTEKKHPPRPPVIAVKIKMGNRLDWATDPNDLNNLLIWMKAKLGVNFTYEQKTLGELRLSGDDKPVLYRTGHHGFRFTPGQRKRIRQYLLNGGTMIFDACCGRREFADAARREIAAILPDYPLKPVPLDHPVFNCFYENAGWVRYTPVTVGQNPGLRSPGPSGIEGVEIKCRMAVVFSPHDMSCGWDMHTHSTPDSSWIQSEDALKVGANLLAYATATRDFSVSLADAKVYVDAEPTRMDKFRVGQLAHEGDWNPDPVGLQNLLDMVGQTTALKISFATEPVQPVSDQLSRFPFLYVTGHDNFEWTESQVAALGQYLRNGGFIFADACCGRQKFDMAFRREIARALGAAGARRDMFELAADHPIYSIHHQIRRVELTEAAHFRFKDRTVTGPELVGGAVNGRLAVVYSPLALNVGWRLKPVPYAVGYEPKSALSLGTNVLIYAMAQ